MMPIESAAASSPARAVGVAAVAVRAAVLATAVAAGVFVYRRAAPRFNDEFWAFALAVALPVLVLAGAWLAREALQQAADRRALERARSSPEHPRRGAWVAVAGPALALEEPFEAPLSGRPALACRYEVHLKRTTSSGTSSTGRSTSRRLLYEGFHLAPTGIESERLGRVRLRGFPDLLALDTSPLAGEFVRPEIAATTPGPVAFRFAARARLLARAGDRLHVDWTYAREEGRPGLPERKERILPPGARVCVLGRWQDGALVPSPYRARGLPVYGGTVEEVLARIGSESKIQLAMAGIALAVVAGLAWAFVV